MCVGERACMRACVPACLSACVRFMRVCVCVRACASCVCVCVCVRACVSVLKLTSKRHNYNHVEIIVSAHFVDSSKFVTDNSTCSCVA